MPVEAGRIADVVDELHHAGAPLPDGAERVY
jgi:hypothetical protein